VKVRGTLSRAWSLARKAADDSLDDHPFEMAAAVSYYTLLALAPLLLVVLAMAGIVFGRDAVESQITNEMRGLIGEQGAEAIQLVLQNARAPAKSWVSLGLGLAALLVGASGVFLQLQSSLNRIWNRASPSSRAWYFLRQRLELLVRLWGQATRLARSALVHRNGHGARAFEHGFGGIQ